MPTSHAKVIKTKENHNLQTKIYHHTLIKKQLHASAQSQRCDYQEQNALKKRKVVVSTTQSLLNLKSNTMKNTLQNYTLYFIYTRKIMKKYVLQHDFVKSHHSVSPSLHPHRERPNTYLTPTKYVGYT